MDLDFIRPARMDDTLTIETKPSEVRGASITLHQKVMRSDELLIEAKVQVAFVSQGRAQRIPKPLREAMGSDLGADF
jgi:acyl-CoA thioester hydrolase